MDASRIIVVDKGKLILSLINYNGEVMDEFPVAIGKEYGNKDTVGDNKTPEGIFRIVAIERSEKWEWDDETDSLPAMKGLYGPWFLRLDTGFEGIGIHGSPEQEPPGQRSTRGCIRLENKDLEKLRKEVDVGTRVIIIPSKEDL
jgi:lipoprotein-anchoring transpeptidase ErfK/SrfK